MQADLIRLDRRPTAWQYCVGVNNIPSTTSSDWLMNCARTTGGPVCNLLRYNTTAGAESRSWATVQFYCAADAERFQQQCNGRMIGGRRIEIGALPKSLTSSTGDEMERNQLPATKAIELVNHLLGFNGWSSEVLEIVAIEDELQPPPPPQQQTRVQSFRARVCVRIGAVEAIGIGESGSDFQGSARPGDAAGGSMVGHAKKAAVTNAVRAALAQLAIIRFRSGKIVVRPLRADGAAAAGCEHEHGAVQHEPGPPHVPMQDVTNAGALILD